MSEPADTYPNAGRASGYTDSSGNAVGENIINRVTELLIAPQTKMLQLAERFDATSALQDQRFGYVLNQLTAFLEKEDQRHDTLAASEDSTLAALTSVAHRLDEITSYVQQSVTLARKVEKRVIEVEKTVMALKKGQVVSDGQIKKFIADVAELRAEIIALREAAALAARIAAQTAEIERRVAEIEAWRAALEARGA